MSDQRRDDHPPVVSCVIIFYNAERFIEDAIESVIAQDYKSWELLVVDDGSRDGARAIVDAYIRDYPHSIRVLEHEGGVNRGKSASRNLGFRHSRGRYIAMLDADDFWLPEKLSQQVAILDQHPNVGIVYSKVSFWYDWTGRPRDLLKSYTSSLGLDGDRVHSGKLVLRRQLLSIARGTRDISPYPSASMFRRDLLHVAGGFDDDFPRLYDDMVFFAKVFLKTNVYLHGGVWAKYRVSPDDEYSLSYQIADASGEWSGDRPNAVEKSYFGRVCSYIDGEEQIDWRLKLAAWLMIARYDHPWIYYLYRKLWRRRSRLQERVHNIAWAMLNRKRSYKTIRWGDLKTVSPLFVGENTRGRAIDREFARQFCLRLRDRITGTILEYGDDARSRKFGHDIETIVVGKAADALLVDCSNDLRFDCVIAIDIIQYLPDIASFLTAVRNRLKESGVALISFPALLPPLQGSEDLWRFTYAGVHKLLRQSFPGSRIDVYRYGNVTSAAAALHGMGTADVGIVMLNSHDEDATVMLFAAIQMSK